MKKGYVDLSMLHESNPLRNTALREIGAQTRFEGLNDETGKPYGWKDVATWKIGASTYNQLGSVWKFNAEWGAKEGGPLR